MNYRNFGKLDWHVSALGFGAMRLPIIGEDQDQIDEPKALEMVRYAIDHGVNYIDTAYVYHGGYSERFLSRSLQDGYRDKVKIATKLHPSSVESADDFDKTLNEQLERLQTDHIDIYLLHGLNPGRWEMFRRLDVLSWAESAIADGRIGHLGFSFHWTYELFQEIIDGYDNWAMCQIQYNYMNEDIQAGAKGLEYAASKGLAVVIMEPLRGGLLVNPPDRVRSIFDEAGMDPVDMALQWLWNQPGVSTVLSGMSTLEQVQQNVASAARSGIGTLPQADLDVIAQVRDLYADLIPIPCTKCRYCMPCPQGVNIPLNFELYNESLMFEKPDLNHFRYNSIMSEEQRASSCIACRECEDKCPQQIEISQWMPTVHELLVNPE